MSKSVRMFPSESSTLSLGCTARAAVAGLLAVLALPSAGGAQAPRDTLTYSVAILPRDPHLTIEARLTVSAPGPVTLPTPPSAGPAGTRIAGFAATDDRGVPIAVRQTGIAFVLAAPAAGAIRFRYRLDLERRVADGSTGSGLDTTRLYAVTRSLFVAPDPTVYRKTATAYPLLRVGIVPPPGWLVVAGWPGAAGEYTPRDGDELLGATLAAAPDFRLYAGSSGGAEWQLAIRGQRYFADSALTAAVAASLDRGAAVLGPAPIPRLTVTSDIGRKGRTSGSLQGRASVGLLWEPSEVLEIARTHDLFHETLHLWFGGAMEAERWWTEGVTDYLAARLYAEWSQQPAALAHLCFESLRNYRQIEHRGRLTMAEETRRGVGGDNTELLVYRKGMLAGLLLDAAIRRGSGGQRTLDSAARQLLLLAAGRQSRSVRESEIGDAVAAAGGSEASRAWARVVPGTDPLSDAEVAEALREVTGQHFSAPPPLAKDRKQLRS